MLLYIIFKKIVLIRKLLNVLKKKLLYIVQNAINKKFTNAFAYSEGKCAVWMLTILMTN
jgi:hypothetical protein